jgi:putative ABC transport system substrate-binding protein
VIDRRAFLGTVGLTVLTVPRLAGARPRPAARVPRVGVVGEWNPVGWTVKTPLVDLECRWAGDRPERLPALASELLVLGVDALVAVGPAAGRAASGRTTRVPVVIVADGDAAADREIAELARSARNVTWLGVLSETTLGEERLALLRTLAPGLRRPAVLFDPETPAGVRAVASLGDAVRRAPAHGVPEDLERTVADLRRDGIDGLVVMADTLLAIHAARLVQAVSMAALPAVYGAPLFVELGGLAAVYGDTGASIHHTASLVGRVLAGELPATLTPPPRPRPHVALATRRVAS